MISLFFRDILAHSEAEIIVNDLLHTQLFHGDGEFVISRFVFLVSVVLLGELHLFTFFDKFDP